MHVLNNKFSLMSFIKMWFKLIHIAVFLVLFAGGLFLEASTTYAAETTRISVDTEGNEANDRSGRTSISSNGRFVAFVSWASNLVVNDNNDASDIFVHDRQTGTTTRVSVNSSGQEANGHSELPAISANGRFVAFASGASNLVAGDTGNWDIFIHNRQTGNTTRVSVDSDGNESTGDSLYPSISADGRFVAFWSISSNLVPNDNNKRPDTFVHDRQTGTTTRVSLDSSGNEANNSSFSNAISADGRYVAFMTWASNLVADDNNNARDIFVHDRQTGMTSRVSVDSTGSEGNGDSSDHISNPPTISADGRLVAFGSKATNLVPGDTNDVMDIFVHDRQSGETTRISVDSDGNESNGFASNPSISPDGRFVSFNSAASNLVDNDTNFARDVFVHDRQTGTTMRVSVDSNNNEGNNSSYWNSISANGQVNVFLSLASNLVSGDNNGVEDVFVYDRLEAMNIIKVLSDNTWKSYDSLQSGWETPGFDDSGWRYAYAPYPYLLSYPPGAWIPGTDAVYMWDWPYAGTPSGSNGPNESWYRKTFNIPVNTSNIVNAEAVVAADDDFDFYVNGVLVYSDWNGVVWGGPYTIDIKPCLVEGENVFAMYAKDTFGSWEWALVDATIEIEIGGIKGDLNDDGCVDRADLSIMLACIRGPGSCEPSYDLNGDGNVNIADARYLVTLFSNPRGAACE